MLCCHIVPLEFFDRVPKTCCAETTRGLTNDESGRDSSQIDCGSKAEGNSSERTKTLQGAKMCSLIGPMRAQRTTPPKAVGKTIDKATRLFKCSSCDGANKLGTAFCSGGEILTVDQH